MSQPEGTSRRLAVGARAPDFCLPSADGRTICLRDVIASGPVLVLFYRGHW
ncbi:MAG: hypothetical protein ACRDLB_01880 [Actinomycetota bacterium]